MDVILHMGAQRTASTTLQAYLDANSEWLGVRRITAWGPKRTRRGGALSGIVPIAGEEHTERAQWRAARDRLQSDLDAAEENGTRTLIVSDENMLGTVRRNLRQKALYPDAFERSARFARAFGDRVTRLVLSIRALDDYWASAIAFGVARGMRLPQASDLEQLAESTRGWRDVLEGLGRAFPNVEIAVHRHETHAGLPDRRLAAMLAQPRAGQETWPEALPMKSSRGWVHRGPDLADLRTQLVSRGDDPSRLPRGQGRWMPFFSAQRSALQELYSDDLFWLQAGGGGFATLLEDRPESDQFPRLEMADKTAAGPEAYRRGHDDDRENGCLAQAG